MSDITYTSKKTGNRVSVFGTNEDGEIVSKADLPANKYTEQYVEDEAVVTPEEIT